MSFVRKSALISSVNPKGCFTNAAETLLTCTGVPSLDNLILSGIPVGSVVGIREDWPRSSSNYCGTLLKCIVAEGLASGQYVVYLDGYEADLSHIESLPGPAKAEQPSSTPVDEKMTIAWRYKHLRNLDDDEPASKSQKQVERSFDLGKKVSAKELCAASGGELHKFSIHQHDFALKMFSLVKTLIEKAKLNNTIVRIVVRSLASPILDDLVWNQLFYKLRQLVGRSPAAILFASLAIHAHPLNASPICDLENLCDLTLEMQSFIGTPQEKNRALCDYNGFLRVVKPLRIPGSLAIALPETNDLAFKIKRRVLLFEPFHMPPSLEESPANAASSDSQCNAMKVNKLDF